MARLIAAIDYYLSVPGFQLEWEHEGFFACVSRDKCRIFLCAGDQGHFGTWVWIGVNDAAVLEVEYTASGAKIRHPPTNYPWAYEMQVEDLDSNVLRFGSDPIVGQPFGAWLDMDGRRWPSDTGRRIRVRVMGSRSVFLIPQLNRFALNRRSIDIRRNQTLMPLRIHSLNSQHHIIKAQIGQRIRTHFPHENFILPERCC